MRAIVRWLVFLALSAGLAAQLPAPWQSWRYSAPIMAPAAPAARLVSVKVPEVVTMAVRHDWSDLRVIDANGGEVPFVLLARTGGRTLARRPARLLEPSAVKGQYHQVLADVGEQATVHNSAHLGIVTEKDLLSWVEIAVSGDLKDWRVVHDRAPVYVLREAGRGENTDVEYPDSASRYLRIRLFDGSGASRISAVEVGQETSSKAEREPARIDLGEASPDAVGRSVWMSNGDASAWPVSRVEFQASQAMFNRHVIVERSDEGEPWQRVTDGNILRAPDGARERAWLSIDFAETHAARWRITIDNQNDALARGLSPTLMMAVRRVVLKLEPGMQYRLLYGNPAGRMPGYDMAKVTSQEQLEAAEPAELGNPETNTAWVDPAPWTERYDAVLWAALVVALGVLGAVAVRTLRSSVG